MLTGCLEKKNQNVNVYNMPNTFCIQVIAGDATDTAYIALDQVKVMRTDCPNIGIWLWSRDLEYLLNSYQ